MNYTKLFTEKFNEVNGWLDTISQRNNGNKSWCIYTFDKPHEVHCFICNKVFDEIKEDVWFHGYNHLKEHNLLPFI